jgi:hypothetical protein
MSVAEYCMDEQPVALDTDLILQSLKFRRMSVDNTQYASLEYRQSELQRVDAAAEQVRSGCFASLDIALLLEALTQAQQIFEVTAYLIPEFRERQLQRVANALAQVRALEHT